jgi:hypothetical protein
MWPSPDGYYILGAVNNLDRQKTGCIGHHIRNHLGIRRISRVAQPFEDHIGVHRVASCNLCHRNTRRSRLKADQPLLFIRPKPLRSTRHSLPHSVRYPQNAVWLGRNGAPLNIGEFTRAIKNRTTSRLKVGVTPHLFRDAAVTTLARASPTSARMIKPNHPICLHHQVVSCS